MRPIRLHLRGMTRYTQPVDLDLEQLPPGLVAITGPNGAGKSTLMECLLPAALFLELPSRPGPLHARANDRDAVIELTTEYDGRRWRHLVQVDPGTGRSGQAVQAFLEVDGAPVDGHPTPGRSSDYELAIGALFPSRELILASVYSTSDGRGNFLELSKAQRRDLFTSMLGGERLQVLAERARIARSPLDAALVRLDDQAVILARDVTRAGELLEQLERLRPELEARAAASQEARAAAVTLSNAATLAASDYRMLLEQRENVQRRRAAVSERLARAQAEVRAHEQEIATDEATIAAGPATRRDADRARAIIAEQADLRAEIMKASGEVARIRAELDGHRREQSTLQLRGVAIAGELAELTRAETALAALDAKIAAGKAAKARRDELAPKIAAEKVEAIAAATDHREAAGKAPSLEAARTRLEAAERAAGLLEGVPCRGQRALIFGSEEDEEQGDGDRVDCGSCRFLVDARQAHEDLPKLRQAVRDAEAAGDRVAELMATAQIAAAELAALETEDRDLAQAAGAVPQLEAMAASHRDHLARRDALLEESHAGQSRRHDLGEMINTAAGRIDRLENEKKEATVKGLQLAAELGNLGPWEDRLRKLETAEARIPGRREQLERSQRDRAEANAELEASPLPPVPTEASVRVQDANAAEAQALTALEVAEGQERTLRDAAARLEGQRAELGDLAARREQLETARGALDRRRAGFRLLETALGRDGIQALEIDAAGPRVSAITNELLAATYGGRFAVALRTTRESADGKRQIETFDLQVVDGLRGRTLDVGDLSRGERILIDEALKLGIACFNAERNGLAMETLYRDECDGGLDPDNAARYPAMLREAARIGGFRNVYFVSHRPEVAAQADAELRITAEGIVSLELP